MKKSKIKYYFDKYKHKYNLAKYLIEFSFSNEEKHWVSKPNKNAKEIELDYHAETIHLEDNEFQIIFYKSCLGKYLETIVHHEILHIRFWSIIEKYESIIESLKIPKKVKKAIISLILDLEHKIIEIIAGKVE